MINFQFLSDYGLISDEHMNHFQYANSASEAWDIIQQESQKKKKKKMDWKTSLDWYCSGNILDKEDIDLLEKYYQQVTIGMDSDDSFEIAPKHICDQTNIPEGSYWITVVTVVLDRLVPVKNGKPRSSIVDQLRRKQGNLNPLYTKDLNIKRQTPNEILQQEGYHQHLHRYKKISRWGEAMPL